MFIDIGGREFICPIEFIEPMLPIPDSEFIEPSELTELREDIDDIDEREEDEGRGLCPGPIGAVWRWNLTNVQRHLRWTHLAEDGKKRMERRRGGEGGGEYEVRKGTSRDEYEEKWRRV